MATLITPEAPACGAHRWAGGGSLGRADLDVEADRLLAERRERERPRVVALDADALLVETLVPRWPLVIFGAGPDARPLVRGARRLGARVTVLDHREAHADAERLPEADATVVAPLEELAAAAPLDARTSCVLMTHNYHHDRALLRPLLESPARYVGLIGPRSRTEQLLEELRDQEGFVPDDAQRARLHAPVGLDIGADDPEAIALSILAEVVAERAGREGGFLRRRQAPLHDPLP
jgi:xanthine/CO dehydrogenase XdhC/CoxF family maturation factor